MVVKAMHLFVSLNSTNMSLIPFKEQQQKMGCIYD